MRICSKILQLYDDMAHLFLKENEKNVFQKGLDLISNEINNRTITHIAILKLKVILELNNSINKIIKSETKSKDLMSLLRSTTLTEENKSKE